MAEPQGNDSNEVDREVGAAQMPYEPNPLYYWVNRDVMGSPCTLTEDYLTELKRSGVICGGGEVERLYRVELPRRGEGVRTKLGTSLLLQRCFVAPSQFHQNAGSAIRCFELVTEFLELPQDPEVFLFLFTVFSPNADGKAKKGYMSVWPGKGRRIFGLYEESFHDFKGRYFKVFPVGDHLPFWLTLERDVGRFPSYWSRDVGVNYALVSYRKLNEEQRDTADVLLWLFSKQCLKPKAILGNPERARATIVKMAERNTTLSKFCQVMQTNPQGLVVGDPPGGQTSCFVPEGGGSSNVGGGLMSGWRFRLPSGKKDRNDKLRLFLHLPRGSEPTTKRPLPKRGRGLRRVRSETFVRRTGHLMLPGSSRETSWGLMLARCCWIVTPWRVFAERSGRCSRQCVELTGNLKVLNQQKADVEKGKDEAESAKAKAEKDLESALASGKEKDVELQHLRDREVSLLANAEGLKKKPSEEKARADKAESSLAVSEEGRQELIKLAEDSVKATEDALKEQILVLAPDFDVSLLGAWKEFVDGQIVDPPPQP
ncbi:hypothetical protein PIB30_016455 [Stylosanthes scabra]|uniref:Uncharacterized protein n=1 Tax=Stylosanthes scabra TaxID=79078 RepID=A0ABU6X858_9FABA|nr:hypothetical protein [Stylosanthes scabra]